MRICLANRRKGNSKGKLYLGSNQFLGCGIAGRAVGRPEIRKFVGALHGKRAKKGVFITTGVYSTDATEYVKNIEPKAVLIDGRQLSEYVIDSNIGVDPMTTYEIKKIVSDYFDEE
jgi:restriction system protein